jgi:MFS family permease
MHPADEGAVAESLQPRRTSWLQLGIVCGAQLVIWTGFSGILPYLPIFLQEEGHSSVIMIGFITAAFYVGALVFSSPFGWLSDVMGRKPMMIAGLALMAVACFLFTLTVDPRWFLLFRLVEGMSAAASGVMFAFVADITAPTHRSRGLGMVMSAQFGGAILGPALSAALYHAGGGGRAGFHAIFYFGAAVAAFTTFVMTFLIREPGTTGRRKASRIGGERRPSYRAVLKPAIVGFLIVSFAANFAFGGFEVIWSLWLDHLGASMTMISVVWIALCVPMLLSFAGGVLADRHNRFILMFAGNTLAALTYVVFGLTTSLVLYLVVGVVQGLAYALANPAKQGFLIQVSPPEWIGTVQGLDTTSMWVGGLLGTLIVPAMYNAISGYVIVVCGAVALVGLVVAAPILWREHAAREQAHSVAGSQGRALG